MFIIIFLRALKRVAVFARINRTYYRTTQFNFICSPTQKQLKDAWIYEQLRRRLLQADIAFSETTNRTCLPLPSLWGLLLFLPNVI